MVDTGSNKNYRQPQLAKKKIQNNKIFFANSVGGKIEITHHTYVNLFNLPNINLKFYLLPSLVSFHAILGNDSLKELSAVIHTKENFMTINDSFKIRLRQLFSQDVNHVPIRNEHMNNFQKQAMSSIVHQNNDLFSDPNEKLTYTTKIVASIRTNSNEPVYTKYYPYPMSLKGEPSRRPSRSPYNSPIWIVPKKQDASLEKKYRLVIDYRKLNSTTIADRYPIPDINEVLSQLGKNSLFSVIDLKSGFHQIPLKESDIEKTAFSVKNGKYEFTRLPFGLKNAPAIFQRTLDDILRKLIGKICYVYIDDIIIFSKDEETHAQNIREVFETLREANMKVQIDKCEFFKKEIEFLGFLVSSEGITTNPTKVQAIVDFPSPKTLKDLRSFLGLSGYYKRFIKDYAKITKPLTNLLRGEAGRISKNQSKNRLIQLNKEAIEAFNQVKNSLISREVILTYPNYQKEFHLTTDASKHAIGAVLEQDGKPITFISRTLTKTEEHYATNEKEMLAIIWALKSLRNYLYGTAKIKLFTDHQPLTYALSNKNDNSKLKRWKAILEEYDHELKYKPGRTNVVADTLSRPPELNTVTIATHSDESSGHNLIPTTEAPINVFKNQIWIMVGQENSKDFKIPFPTYHRLTITRPHYSMDDLQDLLKQHLNPSVINGLFTSEKIMGQIQELYPIHFSNFKIRFTQSQVKDLNTIEQQEHQILVEHKRAHRNAIENKKQIIQKFYFPQMQSKINKIVKQCKICAENKYDRHPNKPEIRKTPIPEYPGQIVHIDIFIAEKNLVLTAIDKYSKYAQARVIKSKSTENIREPLRQILFTFGIPQMIIIDNEKSLNSHSIAFMVEDQLRIKIYKTPPHTHTANGQVERFHSTLAEILRCLKNEKIDRTFEELLDRAVYEYNFSIHSTTGLKPIENFFGRKVYINPEQYEAARQNNIQRLKLKQEKDLEHHNKNKTPCKNYKSGQTIYVKINKRYGTKLTPRYKKEIVKENNSSTVLTESGNVVHKSLIK